ncbi:MAG: nuclear transport factor 2 family protein [Alphaproteobacteria bacterium]
MTTPETIVDRYFAIWNEADGGKRRALIASTWSDGATYVDPLMAVEGADAIDAAVAKVQAMLPGYRFVARGKIDSHNDRLRFAWELVGPDGAAPYAGTDFAVLGADGRLAAVTGFLDRVPPQ